MNSATPASATVVLCENLEAAITHYTDALGYRLDMIMPADAPRVAVVSRDGVPVRLELANPPRMDPPGRGDEFIVTRADAADAWVVGRAGMHYRDLLPGRLGGRLIASHIRIPDGGPVADYVHYHQVRFQMIYCKVGWVRVVYEDQGEPFVMHAGDCVLQPPTIRHRVLESSPGLEVIEIGAPAEHETFREHDITLPTENFAPQRRFGGQRFVRHVAAQADWHEAPEPGFEYRDTGIADATDGLASVRVLRAARDVVSAGANAREQINKQSFLFWQLLDGSLELTSRALGTHTLRDGDTCVIPTGTNFALAPGHSCEVLEVALA